MAVGASLTANTEQAHVAVAANFADAGKEIRGFISFLKGPKAAAIIEKYGYAKQP
jgi:hypothetical protein